MALAAEAGNPKDQDAAWRRLRREFPNDPLTRGQRAVFLSVALGLHWAP